MKQNVPLPIPAAVPSSVPVAAPGADSTQRLLGLVDQLALLNLKYCEKAVTQMQEGTPEQVVAALQAHESLKKAMYMTLALRQRLKAGAARKRRRTAAAARA